MQVLVEFVLHGPSSAFPCVTDKYAPYKQQVLLAVLRLYATDPRVCDVAAAAAGNGAEDLGHYPGYSWGTVGVRLGYGWGTGGVRPPADFPEWGTVGVQLTK